MNNIRALFKQTCCLCPQAVPVFRAADSGKKQAPRTSKKAERKREKKRALKILLQLRSLKQVMKCLENVKKQNLAFRKEVTLGLDCTEGVGLLLRKVYFGFTISSTPGSFGLSIDFCQDLIRVAVLGCMQNITCRHVTWQSWSIGE